MKSWTLLCPIAQNLVMPLLTVSCLFYTLWIILSQQIEFSSNLQLITFIFKAVKTADHHKWPVAKRYTVPSNSTLSRTLNIQQFVHCSRYKFLLISRTFPRTAEHLYSRLRFARVEQPQLKLLNTGWSKNYVWFDLYWSRCCRVCTCKNFLKNGQDFYDVSKAWWHALLMQRNVLQS